MISIKKIKNIKLNRSKKNNIDKEKVKQEKLKQKQETKKIALKLKEETKKINELVSNWQNTFGTLEHWNKDRNGYTLNHIKVHDYGFSCRIYAPWGMSIFDIEKYKPIIDSGLKCESLFTMPQHNQFVMAKFVYPDKVKINEKLFQPVPVKPWEFCPGFDASGEPIIFNINDTPQILIAGMQRKGKNGATDIAIVNWIYSCDETKIIFYMFQGAKNDLSKYKNCKQVYCYTEDIDEMIIALKHILEDMNNRTNLFAPMVARADGNDNIFHYNKLHLENKLPYIIIIIDEFITLMPDEKIEGKIVAGKKNLIINYLQNIAQWGGTYGVNYQILHQKPEKSLCPTFLKNQSSIRICFGFEDLTCCAIVLGDELAKYAHKLPARKAFYSNNESNGYLYTKNLKGQIRKYIEPSIVPNHRTLFGDLEKLNKTSPEIKDLEFEDISLEENFSPNTKYTDKGTAPLPKQTKPFKQQNQTKEESQLSLEFNKVDPKILINEQKIKENTKNIPNFVEFNPNFKPKIIIDQTKIDFTKVQKHVNSTNKEGEK